MSTKPESPAERDTRHVYLVGKGPERWVITLPEDQATGRLLEDMLAIHKRCRDLWDYETSPGVRFRAVTDFDFVQYLGKG